MALSRGPALVLSIGSAYRRGVGPRSAVSRVVGASCPNTLGAVRTWLSVVAFKRGTPEGVEVLRHVPRIGVNSIVLGELLRVLPSERVHLHVPFGG
jgi:hypothetical protein